MTQTQQQPSQSPVETTELVVPQTMSVLSPGLVMKGAEIVAPEEDLTVHGTYDGSIRVRQLVVSEGATVTGEIHAEEVRVWGALRGNIRGDRILIFKGASVGGTVKCDVFGFQPGASMKASIECDASEQIVESATPAAQRRPAQASHGFGDSEFGGLRVVKGGA